MDVIEVQVLEDQVETAGG